MVLDKRGNEEVRVIVAFVHAQRKWNPGFGTGAFQKLRLELGFQELVFGALVDKYSSLSRAPSSSSAQASYLRQCSLLSPRYPLSAFSPQGQVIGEQIGENADTDA